MGYGLPAAVAAKIRHPEREVVCFAGDGCFLMHGQVRTRTPLSSVLLVVVVVAMVCTRSCLSTLRHNVLSLARSAMSFVSPLLSSSSMTVSVARGAQEFATAAMYGAALIVIVVNNGMFGTIRMHQVQKHLRHSLKLGQRSVG